MDRLRLVVASALAALAVPAASLPPGHAIDLAPCHLGSEVVARRVAARCGRLEVPEDRALPLGRTVSLRVAVIPAEGQNAVPDPLVLLAGGPGQAATEVWPAVDRALSRAARNRDVLLFDQRGTGGSSPLTCQALGEPGDVEVPDAEVARRLRACGERLAADHDLEHFRTPDLVEDLEAVRAALGYQRLNLVGVSYGTRAALAYARAHPDRTRTLVLDGVVPFSMAVGQAFDADMQRALDLAFQRCAAEPACRAAFPDPRGDLAALLAAHDRHPERAAVQDPLDGRHRTITVHGDAFRSLVGFIAYLPEAVSLLPLLLAEARQGRLAPLVAFGLAGGRDVASGISRPMQLAVLCAEDVPFYRKAGAPSPIFGHRSRAFFEEACRAFPHGPADAAFREEATLQVPALLLSGEADPVTPPRWGEAALRHLPLGRHLVLAGMGHGTLQRGCVPRLVERFMNAGSAEGLDARCLDDLRPQPFFVDFTGPTP